MWPLFGQVLEIFGLLFVPTSGHTDCPWKRKSVAVTLYLNRHEGPAVTSLVKMFDNIQWWVCSPSFGHYTEMLIFKIGPCVDHQIFYNERSI